MEKKFLKSIVELTRAREPEVLSENLFSSLAEHLPLNGISSLHLFDDKNLTKCEQTVSLKLSPSTEGARDAVWDEHPRRFRLKPDVVEQIPQGEPFTLPTETGCSTYIPVIHEDQAKSLIKIDAAHDISDRHEVIDLFVEIYTNILRVLEDGQRDKLTGLLNRRSFDSKLFRMMELQRKAVSARARADDRRSVLATKLAWLAIIDIDHFKSVNDTHGHVYGDEVILTVGQRMKQVFRSTDLLFRFGGEEFVVVLEPMPVSNAMIALERFRETIERHAFDKIGSVTVSVGFASLHDNEYPPHVIDRADQALYYAKEHGRNQTASYEALIELGCLEETEVPQSA